MKVRYALLFISLLFISGFSVADWSIAEPTDANAEYIKSIEKLGYWNFEWDPTNPISAAMPCCWWEMVYGNQKKYFDAITGETSDSSTSGSSSSIETKSYCPACGVDDDFATLESEPELMDLSEEMMETKPWLKEGKTSTDDNIQEINNTTKASIMTFSDPVKI